MKILAVNHVIDPVSGGGTAERTIQLARQLVALGNECTVLTLDCGVTNELAANAHRNGVELFTLPSLNQRFFIPKFRMKDINSLVERADIIHLMGHWTLLNALISYVARARNKPYITCPAGALHIFGRSHALKRLYNIIVGHAILIKAHGHIAVSENEVSQFADYGIPSDRVTIIPNGVNSADYQIGDVSLFRHKTGIDTAPYILFVGRLNLIKGPDILLMAFSKIAHIYPDYHLVIAGPDGGMGASLKHSVDSLGLQKRVHLVGYVGGAEKVAAYRGAAMIAVPSRQEAMSIVALEAGICGKPVLITDRCGFNAIEHFGGGIIVEATDEGIRDGLLKMLRDSGQLAEMGRRFQRHAEENYTWEAAAKDCNVLFQQVAQRGVN